MQSKTIRLEHYVAGRGGYVSAADKVEGDGATPLGSWPLREIWYRPDRLAPPRTDLPLRVITPDDGWCDDPNDARYNQRVSIASLTKQEQQHLSFERLWREDGAYDIIVVLGYNDAPIIPGKGSAIFMHCMHDDGRPTAGCLALHKNDLLAVLASPAPAMMLHITVDAATLTAT